MSERVGVYAVVKLAPGSYDVLLDGELIAALIHNVDSSDQNWQIDLLADAPASERPKPFRAPSHTFATYRAALDWLGVTQKEATQRSAADPVSSRRVHLYRDRLGPMSRYRLRLLAEHNRYYSTATGLGSLIQRGFIAPTGRVDPSGRAEWAITNAGRIALAEIEP